VGGLKVLEGGGREGERESRRNFVQRELRTTSTSRGWNGVQARVSPSSPGAPAQPENQMSRVRETGKLPAKWR